MLFIAEAHVAVIISVHVARALALLAGRRGPRDEDVRFSGGLVAVRRRLRVDLGFGELEHRVLDRSRGRRRRRALERANAEAGPPPRDPYRQALTMRPSLKARPLVS